MCDGECDPVTGCWGTLPDECVVCRNYDNQGTCVSTCDQLGRERREGEKEGGRDRGMDIYRE